MSKRVAYEPFWYAKARAWDDIEADYVKWFSDAHVEMIKLVRHIKESGLSSRLFAYTSMDKLVVSIYENIDPFKESLHITYDLNSNEWNYKYYGGPLYGQREGNPEFERVYRKEIGIGIENFTSS